MVTEIDRGMTMRPRPRVTPAGIVALSALAAYVVLWIVAWSPPLLAGNTGWLFLYPIFLLAWVGIEALAIVAAVLSIVELVRSRGRVWALVLSLALVLLSLPVLWFGGGTMSG